MFTLRSSGRGVKSLWPAALASPCSHSWQSGQTISITGAGAFTAALRMVFRVVFGDEVMEGTTDGRLTCRWSESGTQPSFG